jgi:hypothetical protein
VHVHLAQHIPYRLVVKFAEEIHVAPAIPRSGVNVPY